MAFNTTIYSAVFWLPFISGHPLLPLGDRIAGGALTGKEEHVRNSTLF